MTLYYSTKPELTKRLAERVLEAEMEMHLGYVKHDPAGNNSGNSRNGKTPKSVRSQNGEIELYIPRDRNSTSLRKTLASF